MAYTKIKPVKHHLQRCLDYTSNPKKTEKFSADDLNRLLSYTQNQNKTEHQLYVTGFRCNPATAYRRMYRTKKRWNQPMDEGDILAYHIIQSFSPGEATPDQVHKIGCEFARRFLADRFECTVSTHLDKGHLHNHIVVNSVSYADGKMFRNNFDTYYHGIRQVSDELCRENRLSVIETDGKGKSYDEWLSGQAGKPTIRGMVRKDVEQAIAAADSFDGFITELQNMGYTVKYVCYDIKELGKQLKKIGMLVVQDQVWNRVTINRAAHKSTRYYIDEMHLLLKEEQSAAYTVEIWKRFRKWGGIPTGITQNVKDLLSSREVENIFENSDFVYMLNQAGGDRQILARQLGISPHQLSYVTHSGEGEGLLFYGSTILPFVDHFPKDTELYRIMTTKVSDLAAQAVA